MPGKQKKKEETFKYNKHKVFFDKNHKMPQGLSGFSFQKLYWNQNENIWPLNWN